MRYTDPSGHCTGDNWCFEENHKACDLDCWRNRRDDKDKNNGVTVDNSDSLSSLPITKTVHPSESISIVQRIPVYDYSVYPPRLKGYITSSYRGEWNTAVIDLNATKKINVVNNLIVGSTTAIVLEVVGCAGPWCVAAQIAINAVGVANNVTTMKAHLYTHYDNVADPLLDMIPRIDITTGELIDPKFNIFPTP